MSGCVPSWHGYSAIRHFVSSLMTADNVIPVLFILLQSHVHVSGSSCLFPQKWIGRWYQNRMGDVIIRDDAILEKGICKEHRRDYYLLDDRKRMCSLCLLIIQRHENIIQYRESYCMVGTFNYLCSKIQLEAPLYTLVRVDGRAVRCPFQNVFQFIYNNNTNGFCRQPTSYVESCASETKFHFHFRHCNDVVNTLEQDMEFECLAVWKDGSDMFLYGGFYGASIASQEYSYRCFLYEENRMQAYMSMSADASCQDLRSPQDGPLVLNLVKDIEEEKRSNKNCRFPVWFRSFTWYDVSNVYQYMTSDDGRSVEVNKNQRTTISRQETPETIMRWQCLNIDSDTDPHESTAHVAHFHGCQINHLCVKLMKRSEMVVEINIGEASDVDNCSSNVTRNASRNVLLARISHGSPCPNSGKYQLRRYGSEFPSEVRCLTQLVIGCNRSDIVHIHRYCSHTTNTLVYQCMFNWRQENKTNVVWRNMNVEHPMNVNSEHPMNVNSEHRMNVNSEHPMNVNSEHPMNTNHEHPTIQCSFATSEELDTASGSIQCNNVQSTKFFQGTDGQLIFDRISASCDSPADSSSSRHFRTFFSPYHYIFFLVIKLLNS